MSLEQLIPELRKNPRRRIRRRIREKYYSLSEIANPEELVIYSDWQLEPEPPQIKSINLDQLIEAWDETVVGKIIPSAACVSVLFKNFVQHLGFDYKKE